MAVEDNGQDSDTRQRSRLRLTISGVVQGVGFRPHVYRLARSLQLKGFALNQGGDVVLEVEGPPESTDRFLDMLQSQPPPAASIDQIHVETLPPADYDDFSIERSVARTPGLSGLAPDLAPCPECLAELRDPRARRFGYPLLSCSDCGPRYTIFTDLPYDRERTTMTDYPLCEDCRREYEEPADRRYHAEPLACPVCGPEVRLLDPEGTPLAGDPLRRTGEVLSGGGVVAVKGVGGYLLAADATDREVVTRLRRFKRRPAKPLALMVPGLEEAGRLVDVTGEDRAAMSSPATPIVLCRATGGSDLLEHVAPGMSDLGVMVPSTPLHHLMFDHSPPVLVMTSGNLRGEPILGDDERALASLDADAFLVHDRPVENPIDDSVVKPPVIIRRARGYVPRPLETSLRAEGDVLALGGQMKATFAFMRDGQILPGRPVGDMETAAVEDVWLRELGKMEERLGIRPSVVAHDLHPGYRSTVLAGDMSAPGGRIAVQHHHAHLAAVLAEHGMGPEDRAVGIMLDGTGYGTDGTVWGGEVLLGDMRDFERIGHLLQVALPGGGAAVREPRRMAESLRAAAGLDPADAEIASVCRSRRLSPLTSSTGRLLDGAAHLCGIAPDRMSYDAQAAMLFESAAADGCREEYPFEIHDGVIDSRPMIRALVEDRSDEPIRAARFHNTLCRAFSTLAAEAALATGLPVVLGGGCFANRILLKGIERMLEKRGIQVLHGRRLPVGDGAVAPGQAAVAAARTFGKE
ncbi:carbamoyltransferase HypF [Candidatus Fermentibacteria bacterium]|nr:carbamoyltransferase HypF [Candidatus Fermentibacteria bacterium]